MGLKKRFENYPQNSYFASLCEAFLFLLFGVVSSKFFNLALVRRPPATPRPCNAKLRRPAAGLFANTACGVSV